MNILLCIPCLKTGGTEVQSLSLIQALREAGHHVLTACYFEHEPEMMERFRRAGSDVVCFSPSGQRLRGWRSIPFLYKNLRRLLKQYKPAAAHVQYMAPGALPCLLLKALGIPKLLVTAHTDADIYSPKSLRLLHFVQRHVADAFCCISQRAEQAFFGSSWLYDGSSPLPPHCHLCIHNGLPAHIRVRAQRKKRQAAPVIGVLSRLESIKGMDLILPAFAQLRRSLPEARLLVVGDGKLASLMKEQAKEFGVKDAVRHTGARPANELESYYDQMDLFWMPSRSEGFGLSALEAMARGCPVVAADVGGLPEIIEDGQSGRLVPPEDSEALATAAEEILRDPQGWQMMSDEARRRAEQFSMERYRELHRRLYETLLS